MEKRDPHVAGRGEKHIGGQKGAETSRAGKVSAVLDFSRDSKVGLGVYLVFLFFSFFFFLSFDACLYCVHRPQAFGRVWGPVPSQVLDLDIQDNKLTRVEQNTLQHSFAVPMSCRCGFGPVTLSSRSDSTESENIVLHLASQPQAIQSVVLMAVVRSTISLWVSEMDLQVRSVCHAPAWIYLSVRISPPLPSYLLCCTRVCSGNRQSGLLLGSRRPSRCCNSQRGPFLTRDPSF